MSNTEASKQVARRFIETFSRSDYAQWAQLIADDAIYEFPGTSAIAGTYTKANVLQMLQGLAAIFPTGIKLEARTMTAEDDRISVEARGTAVSADGQPYNNTYHFMFVVCDGKIKEAREYMDSKLVDKVIAGRL